MEKKCVKETNNVTWTRGRVVTCLQRIALRRTANGRALIDRCRRTHVGLYVDRHTIIRIFISSIRMYPLTSIARLHQTMFVAFASSRGDNSVLRWKIERIYEDLALFLSLSLLPFYFDLFRSRIFLRSSIVRIPRGFNKIAMLLRKTSLSRSLGAADEC